ncbi:hypothetical protein [Metapseudomonas otitidis]|uniref:hypothetical protein n=1 Tax=Metapseudomonas otitidis TaxID=319939 RepID=UPI001F2AA8F4|nr:hypothetical protein [Pseudomonas otitidis]
MSHPEVTKETPEKQEAQEPQSAVEIACDAVECMRLELLSARELISVLRAIDRDMDSTQHIRQLCRAGMKAAEYVCEGLDAMADVFTVQLKELQGIGTSAQSAEVAHG